MMAAGQPDAALKLRVRELYEAYFACLDSQDIRAWPGFFTEDATYLVQSEENRRNGYAVGDISCQGGAMFRDRAAAIAGTTVYERRLLRHFPGNLRLGLLADGVVAAEMSYLAIETVADEMPVIFSAGRSIDEIRVAADGLLFRRRQVVYDHGFIRHSLVFPL